MKIKRGYKLFEMEIFEPYRQAMAKRMKAV